VANTKEKDTTFCKQESQAMQRSDKFLLKKVSALNKQLVSLRSIPYCPKAVSYQRIVLTTSALGQSLQKQ